MAKYELEYYECDGWGGIDICGMDIDAEDDESAIQEVKRRHARGEIPTHSLENSKLYRIVKTDF